MILRQTCARFPAPKMCKQESYHDVGDKPTLKVMPVPPIGEEMRDVRSFVCARHTDSNQGPRCYGEALELEGCKWLPL
jgi:hypothetical protein